MKFWGVQLNKLLNTQICVSPNTSDAETFELFRQALHVDESQCLKIMANF